MMKPDPVQRQYEAFPYPARNPRDEDKRLITGSPSEPAEVNHYLFAGRRDWSRPFRALVAGGGTGDGLIMLAQRLADRGCPAEIHYLDLSRAARGIAEARAARRGLGSITFHTGSLTDLEALGLGGFDYIDCCGVLHHLEDPAAGLKALVRALAPGGGLGLMVYGRYGRTGVYEAQEMLRTLAPPREDDRRRLETARRLLKALPPTNRLKRNPFVRDHIDGGDAGLYDLLLHGRDRAYTVPALLDLLAGAGLAPTALLPAAAYDPATYLRDPALLKRLQGLSFAERAAFAERLAGNMKTHVLYAAPADGAAGRVAQPDDAMVPVPLDFDAGAAARAARPGAPLKVNLHGLALTFALPPLAGAMLARIDGRRGIAAIREELRRDNPRLDDAGFARQFQALYAVLNGLNKLVLAGPARG